MCVGFVCKHFIHFQALLDQFIGEMKRGVGDKGPSGRWDGRDERNDRGGGGGGSGFAGGSSSNK